VALRKEAADFDDDPRPELVGQIVRRWAARAGVLQVSDRDRVWAAWRNHLGSLADHTRLEGLRNHVAYFAVDSSALLAELNNFYKTELIAMLQRDVRSCFVSDLRFRLEKRR